MTTLPPQRFFYPDNPEYSGSYQWGPPYMPIVPGSQPRVFKISALVHSGSMVNILPYRLGLALGAVWEEQTRPTTLTGNLADVRPLRCMRSFRFRPSKQNRSSLPGLKAIECPPILGKMNFFLEV